MTSCFKALPPFLSTVRTVIPETVSQNTRLFPYVALVCYLFSTVRQVGKKSPEVWPFLRVCATTVYRQDTKKEEWKQEVNIRKESNALGAGGRHAWQSARTHSRQLEPPALINSSILLT